jgi:hypothetical protein
LAKRLLAGEFKDGDTVVVDAAMDEEGRMQLAFLNRAAEPIAVELPMSHQVNGPELTGK